MGRTDAYRSGTQDADGLLCVRHVRKPVKLGSSFRPCFSIPPLPYWFLSPVTWI